MKRLTIALALLCACAPAVEIPSPSPEQVQTRLTAELYAAQADAQTAYTFDLVAFAQFGLWCYRPDTFEKFIGAGHKATLNFNLLDQYGDNQGVRSWHLLCGLSQPAVQGVRYSHRSNTVEVRQFRLSGGQ